MCHGRTDSGKELVTIPMKLKYLAALDIGTGEEVARYKSGDAANVTMASDGRTIVAQSLSFIESCFKGRLGFEVKGGVWAWEPVAD